MNADTLTAQAPAPRPRAARPPVDPALRGDLLLYLLLAALVGSAWQISRAGWFGPSDDISYWLAVAGGTAMLLLFAYPLRKYSRVMQRLGRMKFWFWWHLSLGILGPWLILIHSGFRVGSLNAGVALYSMCIVVASGVVGRFMYVRVRRGLDGERSTLEDLRERAGMVESEVRSRLHFAPDVEAAVVAFEERELRARPGWATWLRQVLLLPLQQQYTAWRCRAALRARLRDLASRQGWTPEEHRRRLRRSRKLVDRYLDAVVRVAQYTAFERLFALWHLAHLPFIYLLVISAIVHVIAVHAY